MSVKRLFVNTGSNIVVTFLKMVIAFIMTPILVKNLGDYDYGMWEIIVSIIGYMGLLDMGMRPTVTRNVAYYSAKKDVLSVKEVFSTAIAFMLLLSSVSLVLFLSWAYFNPGILAETESDVQRYQYLLIIIAFQLAFFFPGAVAESTLDGFHKYYLKNNVTIINTLIGNFLIWYLIKPENAILVVAGISALGVSIKYLIYFVFIAKSVNIPMIPRPKYFTKVRLKELIRFGSKSFVQGVVWRIQTTIDPILIATVISPAAVIFYAIPSNLINYARGIAMTMTQAFLPIFSEMAAETDKTKQHAVYLLVSKIIVALLMPIFVGIFVVGPDFISLWIGPEYGEGGRGILYALTVIVLIAYLDPFANKFLTAEDKHGIYAKVMPFALAVNFAVTIVLLNVIGVLGAAIGTLVPTLLFSPIYWVYRSKIQKLSLLKYFSHVLAPLAVPGLMMAIAMLAVMRHIAIDSFLNLISIATVGVAVYASVYLAVSVSSQERQAVIKFIRRR